MNTIKIAKTTHNTLPMMQLLVVWLPAILCGWVCLLPPLALLPPAPVYTHIHSSCATHASVPQTGSHSQCNPSHTVPETYTHFCEQIRCATSPSAKVLLKDTGQKPSQN